MRGPFTHPYDEDALRAPPRHLQCKSYDRCLNEAVKQGWPTWQCGECDGYEEISSDEKMRDMFGLLALFGEVKCPAGKKRRFA